MSNILKTPNGPSPSKIPIDKNCGVIIFVIYECESARRYKILGTDGSGSASNHNVDRRAKSLSKEAPEMEKYKCEHNFKETKPNIH